MGIDVWASNRQVISYWTNAVFNHNGEQVATVVALVGNEPDREKTLLSEMLKALGQKSTDLTQTEQIPAFDTKRMIVFGSALNKQLVKDAAAFMCIDYTVEHLLKNPQLKAEVWQTLCQSSMLRSALFDHHHANSSLSSG